MIVYGGEKNKTELLSPAGGMRALLAAVQNGADAVYLGADRFSARASAENFDGEALKTAVKYCKMRGVKTYLAINTLILEDEMKDALSLATFAANAGVDALIVQDIGFAKAVRECVPKMQLHASTQMTVHSLQGVRFLEENGFSRVVLSRELSKAEIEYILKRAKAEIEVFVHGALCVCYSGKCLMSSMIGGRSGNRGSCAQPCRLPVKIGDRQGYLMSTFDLSLADEVNSLKKMGVASLKIEGRMKSGEYVAIVTGVFRKIIDTGHVSNEDVQKLKDIFCRGGHFTKGYFGGETGSKMINSHLSNDKTGKVAPKTLLNEAEQSFREGLENRKIPAGVEFFMADKPTLTIKAMGKSATVQGEVTDAPPLGSDRIKEQISKLGQTPLYPESIKVLCSECSIKISTLNSMRRNAADMLLEKIAEVEERDIFPYVSPVKTKGNKGILLSASVLKGEQIKALAESKIQRIFVPLHLCSEAAKLAGDKEVFISLPTIIKDGELSAVQSQIKNALRLGIKGFLCDSYDALYEAQKYKKPIVLGSGLGISNLKTLEFFKNIGAECAFLSSELAMGEIKKLAGQSSIAAGVMVYGRHRVMLTENCLIKAAHGKCVCGNVLTDKVGAQFPILRDGSSHRNAIYNHKITDFTDSIKRLADAGVHLFNIQFTTENEEECKKVIDGRSLYGN